MCTLVTLALLAVQYTGWEEGTRSPSSPVSLDPPSSSYDSNGEMASDYLHTHGWTVLHSGASGKLEVRTACPGDRFIIIGLAIGRVRSPL